MVWCKAVRNSGNILHPKLRLNKIIKVANKCITFSAVSSSKIHAASSRRMPRWPAPLGLDSNLEITALCIYTGAKEGTKLEFTRPMHSEDSPDKMHDSQRKSLEQLLLQWRHLPTDPGLHQAPISVACQNITVLAQLLDCPFFLTIAICWISLGFLNEYPV